MTRPMNNPTSSVFRCGKGAVLKVTGRFLAPLLITLGATTLPMNGYCEEMLESLTVQFSGTDLLSVERGIQEALEREPVAGSSSEPLTSPYAFGTITARGINYSFNPRIHQTELLDGAFKFNLSIHNFRGRIARLDLNQAGTRGCVNIDIHSPGNEIPVAVVVRPQIDEFGGLSVAVTHSDFDLNDRNFKVNYPENCHVLFGMNWLIKWTLPWLIESYKDTIADALSDALAKGLRERSAEVSPLLSLNVTLPFEGIPVPPFYATVGIRPYKIDVDPERIQSTFATSIQIDPDIVSPFSEPSSWPSDLSFFGISWDFLNGIFREAQAKGIIHSKIMRGDPSRDQWLAYDRWSRVWPAFSARIPRAEELSLTILGGSRYTWFKTDSKDYSASLVIDDLRIRLESSSGPIADFTFGLKSDFSLSSGADGKIKASLASIQATDMGVVPDSGSLSNDPVNEGVLPALAHELENEVGSASNERRELFNIEVPGLKIGNHQILIREIRTSAKGIILPLRYQHPQ